MLVDLQNHARGQTCEQLQSEETRTPCLVRELIRKVKRSDILEVAA